MEFSLICPNDGEVEVGLEDIASIVFSGFETVEVLFVCPVCGTEIRVNAKMPNLMITTLDLSSMLERSLEVASVQGFLPDDFDEDDFDEEDFDDEDFDEGDLDIRPRVAEAPALTDEDKARIERYCEYFKRQLLEVDTVEKFLQEVDQK